MSLTLDGTNGETFPSWTTATRPASPVVGQVGYNTTTGNFDAYTSSGWTSVITSTTAQGSTTGTVTSNGPAFSAYNTIAGNIAASTATKISYDTKTFDTNTCFNNTSGTVTLNGISTPSYSFAPNVAGYYLINGSWCTNSASAQNMNIELFKNGSLYQYSNWQTQNSGLGGVITGTFIVYLNGVSDYVSMYVVDSIAVGTTSGSIYTYFQGALIRTA